MIDFFAEIFFSPVKPSLNDLLIDYNVFFKVLHQKYYIFQNYYNFELCFRSPLSHAH